MSIRRTDGVGREKAKSGHPQRTASVKPGSRCLDSVQLNQLETSFRRWAEESSRSDVRLSRRRILLIFLLIRYTGAKLNEVLALDLLHDIDHVRQSVFFRSFAGGEETENKREVQISEVLSAEIRTMLADSAFRASFGYAFGIDPAFVRRKFYERAEESGFPKQLGAPEMIRKSRGAELMQSNIPLPAVQVLMGHSTPGLTSSYVTFSRDEIRQITKHFVEKEASRKTSARNCFFGKIRVLQCGDIQSLVEITTLEGHSITTVITNDSAGRLGLREGKLITAEVKAPWVILYKGGEEPVCTAENRFHGIIERVNAGRINTEYIVRISDQIELCSVITTGSSRRLKLKKGDSVWVLFNSFAVVLHTD
ncbi:MAG TPA: TOBE domain-containing protein [Dissulfurispiraceae bacterium]|nr:TOBE domain-containing protein [Dissulfurispiraceae bacterium]